MIHRARYWQDVQNDLQDGDIIVGCQLSQKMPHTLIGEGISYVTVRECSCENVDFPASWDVDSSNYRVQKSLCCHLRDGLPYVCTDECEHMVEKTIIEIDDVQIVEYQYEDKVVQ